MRFFYAITGRDLYYLKHFFSFRSKVLSVNSRRLVVQTLRLFETIQRSELTLPTFLIRKRKMAHEIFISHSSKDKTIADAIVACLERRGLRCWVAPRDIVAGMDWSASIIDGINGAKVMVLILSENSNVSKQVLREIERAANRGISILPFRVSDVELSKSLEYFLSSAHWLDAYHGKLKDHIDVLSNNVANILDNRMPLLM